MNEQVFGLNLALPFPLWGMLIRGVGALRTRSQRGLTSPSLNQDKVLEIRQLDHVLASVPAPPVEVAWSIIGWKECRLQGIAAQEGERKEIRPLAQPAQFEAWRTVNGMKVTVSK